MMCHAKCVFVAPLPMLLPVFVLLFLTIKWVRKVWQTFRTTTYSYRKHKIRINKTFFHNFLALGWEEFILTQKDEDESFIKLEQKIVHMKQIMLKKSKRVLDFSIELNL